MELEMGGIICAWEWEELCGIWNWEELYGNWKWEELCGNWNGRNNMRIGMEGIILELECEELYGNWNEMKYVGLGNLGETSGKGQ